MLHRTLANEGLKRSIFGLGSGGSTNAANSDGSPTCTVGTRTTRINSCGCSTSRDSIRDWFLPTIKVASNQNTVELNNC